MAQPEETFINSRVFGASAAKGRPPSTPLQVKSGVPDASSALSPAARIRKPQAAAGGSTSPIISLGGKENALNLSRGGTDKEFDLEPPTETIYEIPRSRNADRGAPLLVPSASSSSSSTLHAPSSTESTAVVQISKTDEMEVIKREQQKRWITVFGFATSDRSSVLQQFRNYGEVTRTVFPPNDANWMHIQFLNSFQSGSALTKNGLVLNGRIMIGVVECTEKSLAEGPAEVASAPAPPLSNLTATDIMRPQQRSFHAAGRTEYNIERTPEPGPQSAQSWWSKIREYVIGV